MTVSDFIANLRGVNKGGPDFPETLLRRIFDAVSARPFANGDRIAAVHRNRTRWVELVEDCLSLQNPFVHPDTVVEAALQQGLREGYLPFACDIFSLVWRPAVGALTHGMCFE